jgi:hypothetical protein
MAKKRTRSKPKVQEASSTERTSTYDAPPPPAPELLDEWFEDDPLGEADAGDF